MKGRIFCILLSFLVFHQVVANNEVKKRFQRLSLFNVVTFPNEPCQGNGNKNGTCYTSVECEERGGTSNGECANGYGVCCLVSLDCGGKSGENLTYLEMAETSTPPHTNCEYTICKCQEKICRIRLDFEVFTLAAPEVEGSSDAGLHGGAIGDCATDSFSVSGSHFGSPAICGTNAGQHIYADVNSDCVRPNFLFGVSSNSRKYTIKVTQYVCNDEMGGPTGCLQYFHATSGTVASFNYPIGTSSIASATTITHLSDQNYDICFRRADDNCKLCFTPTIATDPSSYGIGVAATTDNKGTTSTSCTADYLIIPQMEVSTISNDPIHTSAIANLDRICGRKFTTINEDSQKTICTARKPFQIKFRTDQNEVDVASSATVINDETNGTPKGYIGFSLDFFQQSC